MKGIATLVAASLLVAGMPVHAQLMDKKSLTLAEARKAVAAAAAEAKKNNWNVVIAVVDDAGYVLTLDRLDNTQRASVDIAIGKARTAALFRRPSGALEETIAKGRNALLSVTGYVFLQGGMPIVAHGEVVGAVGVSGARSDQDEQVAKAGADALAPPSK